MPEVEKSDPVEELTEALFLTARYYGPQNFPPVPGWSWYDALVKYAPEKAKKLIIEWGYCTNCPGETMPCEKCGAGL